MQYSLWLLLYKYGSVMKHISVINTLRPEQKCVIL